MFDFEEEKEGIIDRNETNILLSPPTLVLFFQNYLTCDNEMRVTTKLDITPYIYRKEVILAQKSTDYSLRNMVTYSKERGYTSYVLYDTECFEFHKGLKRKLESPPSEQMTGVVMLAYSKRN